MAHAVVHERHTREIRAVQFIKLSQIVVSIWLVSAKAICTRAKLARFSSGEVAGLCSCESAFGLCFLETTGAFMRKHFIYTFAERCTHRACVIAVAVAGTGLIALPPNVAHAIDDGLYKITSTCNGKTLGLRNGNPNPWDDVVVASTGTWDVRAVGDGTYVLRVPGTQSAMQTAYAKTTTATDVDLWTYANGAAQRWVISDAGNGAVKFSLAAAQNMALDLQAAGANGESNVWLYDDNGTCAQRWTMSLASEPGGSAADAFAMQKKLGRGINFGNMLEASPVEGSWGVSLSDELFDKAKEAGFSTIRLPVRWSNYAQTTAPYTISPSFFQRVDYAVNAATSRGMNIVINMHHHRQLCGEALDNGEPSVNASVLDERFASMWNQIATRYKDQPIDRVLFEPYNEPNTGCNGARWNTLSKRALDEIRKTNPTRFVVLGPSSWNSADALKDFAAPTGDSRVIITIHNYNPFRFTHQGAGWAGSDAESWVGTTCCDATQIADIVRPLDVAKQWAGTRWPIWLGEFGAYERAPFDSRVRYSRIVRDEVEKRGFTWAYWEMASGFGIWDPNARAWRTQLRDALVGP
jgi:endoglucanase